VTAAEKRRLAVLERRVTSTAATEARRADAHYRATKRASDAAHELYEFRRDHGLLPPKTASQANADAIYKKLYPRLPQ
jgi:hypothetical protein